MTTLPKIQIVDEHLPVVPTTTALTSAVEMINEDLSPDDWDIHLIICGAERTIYTTLRHPERAEADDLDPQWLPVIVEQVTMDAIATGFVLALQVPLLPGMRCAVGLGFEATGQTWAYTTVNGMPLQLPIIAQQMQEDAEAVAKRLWGPSWEPLCVGHDHEHD
jgi:hypothetical protein